MRRQNKEMSQIMKNTATLRNHRNEYLFVPEDSYDDQNTHIVLIDRNGSIIRSYDLQTSLNVTIRTMVKAGWHKADF
jgi:hypothetical protein